MITLTWWSTFSPSSSYYWPSPLCNSDAAFCFAQLVISFTSGIARKFFRGMGANPEGLPPSSFSSFPFWSRTTKINPSRGSGGALMPPVVSPAGLWSKWRLLLPPPERQYTSCPLIFSKHMAQDCQCIFQIGAKGLTSAPRIRSPLQGVNPAVNMYAFS